MFNYRYTTAKKVVFSITFFMMSILLFIMVIFNPKIYSDSNVDIQIIYIPVISVIIAWTQSFIYQVFLAIGPAIHFPYIIFFIWAITLWENRYPFSFIQGFIGLLLLLTSFSVASQAYCLFWDGNLSAGNSIGYRVVSEILVPHLD